MNKLSQRIISDSNYQEIVNDIKKLTDYMRSFDQKYDMRISGYLKETLCGYIELAHDIPYRRSIDSILKECDIKSKGIYLKLGQSFPESKEFLTNNHKKTLYQISALFGPSTDSPIVIYIITYILFKIFPKNLYIYVSNHNEAQNRDKIEISSKISYTDNLTNISRPIKPFEILKMNPTDLIWTERGNKEKEYGSSFYDQEWYRMIAPLNYTLSGYHDPFDPNELVFKEEDLNTLGNKSEEDMDDNKLNFEKYGGAYGYDDDAIDTAFEGDPENYWNID